MAHASNTPRPDGSRKPRRSFWRGLGGFLLHFVKPNDWRALTVGIFLIMVGLGGVLNTGGDPSGNCWDWSQLACSGWYIRLPAS